MTAVPQPGEWVSAPPQLSKYASGNVQVIYPGSSQDLSFLASGVNNSTRTASPILCSVIRIALGATKNVRLAFGDSSVNATATSMLIVGPIVEYFGFVSGNYVAAISDDANTGSINLTAAS